jgi:hypothetical protein
MAIQTRYTKNGFSFDCDVTPEFAAAYEATVAAYPVLEYPIDMGIKQSVTDAYASKTDAAAIEGAGRKKWDAIMAGTVRVAGRGERTPSKTPMEREIWRLATAEMADVFARNAKAGNPVAKEKQAHYIGLFIDRERERLTELAMAAVDISLQAHDDLDALFAVMEDADEDDEDESVDES